MRQYPCHTNLRLLLGAHGPELPDGVADADVVRDDVEQAAEGREGEQVDERDGQLREQRAHHAGAHVVNSDRLETPAKDRIEYPFRLWSGNFFVIGHFGYIPPHGAPKSCEIFLN